MMMTNGTAEGLAQSVKQRLLNRARARGEVFNHLLVRYTVERMLYRLTQSRHGSQFVLKGAMLFVIWAEKPYRPTLDVDLLAYGPPSAQRLEAIFRDICDTEVPADGLAFDPGLVRIEPIRADAVYDGFRVRLVSMLGTARIPLQIDVGFGDAVIPPPAGRDLRAPARPTGAAHPHVPTGNGCCREVSCHRQPGPGEHEDEGLL